MVFCGQCGLQLTPGTTQCPRCGAKVEADAAAGEFHADDPTVASQSILNRKPQQSNTPQRLVLRPGQDEGSYNPAYDSATSRVEQPNFGTQQASYPGYVPQSGGNYPGQAAYPDYRTSGGNYPQGASYPGIAPQSGMGYPSAGQYGQMQESHSGKGRVVGLVFILIGLLLILTAVILFAVQNSGQANSAGNGITGANTPGPSVTAAPSTTQQAQAIIQQYYDHVNAHNYQAAYDLWQEQARQQTFTQFKNGYKNTLKDTITFGDIVEQSDGTVKVTVTVVATEKQGAGTKQSTYTGFYIVGKQSDGKWKILQGNFQ